MDTKAINHILMNSNDYQKSKASRSGLGRIVGPGKSTRDICVGAPNLHSKYRRSCCRRYDMLLSDRELISKNHN